MPIIDTIKLNNVKIIDKRFANKPLVNNDGNKNKYYTRCFSVMVPNHVADNMKKSGLKIYRSDEKSGTSLLIIKVPNYSPKIFREYQEELLPVRIKIRGQEDIILTYNNIYLLDFIDIMKADVVAGLYESNISGRKGLLARSMTIYARKNVNFSVKSLLDITSIMNKDATAIAFEQVKEQIKSAINNLYNDEV